MAFASFFNSKLTEPLTSQLMAVLQRDMVAALGVVDSTLPTFAEWNFAFYLPTQWPALLLVPRNTVFDNPASVQSRPQTVTIEIVVALAGQDRNKLAQQAWRYIRAVDIILSSLGAEVNASNTPNFSDFYTALPLIVPFPQAASQSAINIAATTPMQTGSVKACYPTRLSYSDMQRSAAGWEMTATLELTVRVEET